MLVCQPDTIKFLVQHKVPLIFTVSGEQGYSVVEVVEGLWEVQVRKHLVRPCHVNDCLFATHRVLC